MRTLSELQALALEHQVSAIGSREEIMDRLRDKVGSFDPSVQIDPMKARDMKRQIDWSLPGAERFTFLDEGSWTGWTLEPKLDGARMRMFLGAAGNTMNTGRRSDESFAYIERADNFPHMRDAACPELAGTILDGELMPPCKSLTTVSGVTTKGTLNSAMALVNVNPAHSIATQERFGPANFFCFDILMLQGTKVTDLPQAARRTMLEAVVARLNEAHPDCEIRVIPSFECSSANAQRCLDEGFEGAMVKWSQGKYEAGKRSSNWLKVKTMSTCDAFIVGSVDGKGRNSNLVGSLSVALMKPGCTDWSDPSQRVGIADVGGFTDGFRAELTGPDGKVKPELLGTVIEVMAQCVTKNSRLRHPHFVVVRPDKSALDCQLDQLEAIPEA